MGSFLLFGITFSVPTIAPKVMLTAVIPLTDSFIFLMRALIVVAFLLILLVLIAETRGLSIKTRHTPKTWADFYSNRPSLCTMDRLLGTPAVPAVDIRKRSRRVSSCSAGGIRHISNCTDKRRTFQRKVRALRVYAIIEAAFAFLVCTSTLSSMKDRVDLAQTGTLGASAYLFIRAADNFKKDLDERKARANASSPKAGSLPFMSSPPPTE